MSDAYLDVGGVNARVAAFDEKHGKSVYHEGWIRFEDGACREGNPMGLMVEPPDNLRDRHRRIVLFHKIVMERAIRKFDEAKNNFKQIAHANLNNGTNYGPSPKQIEAQLTPLQTAARAAKAKYDAAVEASGFAKEEAARGQIAADNRRQNESVLAAINGIEL